SPAGVTAPPISGLQPSSVIATLASQPPGQRHQHRLAERPERAKRVVDGRGLMAAMHHAVPALVIAAPAAVVIPVRRVHQLLEGRGVALLKEVAGPLPAEDVVRG